MVRSGASPEVPTIFLMVAVTDQNNGALLRANFRASR